MQAKTTKNTKTATSNTRTVATGATPMVAMVLLAGSLVLASGCAANRASQSFVFDGRIDDVMVDLDSGDVIVTGTDQDETRVELDLVCRGGTPEYAVDRNGGKLSVTGRAGWRGEEACSGTVRIAAPRHASLEVSVSRGDVAVAGVAGEVAIETYEGDIECDDAANQVAIKTESTSVASGIPSVVFQ